MIAGSNMFCGVSTLSAGLPCNNFADLLRQGYVAVVVFQLADPLRVDGS
jgi:hypothetical protein